MRFTVFGSRLIISFPSLSEARRRSIVDILNRCMVPFPKLQVALDVELTDTVPHIADNSTADQ